MELVKFGAGVSRANGGKALRAAPEVRRGSAYFSFLCFLLAKMLPSPRTLSNVTRTCSLTPCRSPPPSSNLTCTNLDCMSRHSPGMRALHIDPESHEFPNQRGIKDRPCSGR